MINVSRKQKKPLSTGLAVPAGRGNDCIVAILVLQQESAVCAPAPPYG